MRTNNLAARQKALRDKNKRLRALVRLQRAKSRLLLRESTKRSRSAAKAITLRDRYLETLRELRGICHRANRNIEHMKLSRQRALRRAAIYSVQAEDELARIERLRLIGEMP